MSEKKKLNEISDEELENVNGGGSLCSTDDTWAADHMKYLPNKNVEHVCKEHVCRFAGRKFYMVNDTDAQAFCYGQLVSSTGSYHTIYVESIHDHFIPKATGLCFNDVKVGDTITRYASAYTMFLEK